MEKIVKQFDEEEAQEVETDCCMCFNLMIESCVLPCRHRFCIQCMRSHLNYQTKCPMCRAEVPDYFKMQYYHHNVDREFQKILQARFPLEYEA